MSIGEVSQFRFGPFEISPATGELRKGDIKLKLQPQPFRLLLLLVSRPGELVSREELRETVWSDGTTVEFDQSLNFCIRQIRAALADDAHDPKYIETLPKRGYRFIAPVTTTTAKLDPDPDPQPEPASPALANWRPAVWVTLAMIAALASALFLARRTAEKQPSPSAILVRPFVNLDLAAEDAWFSDALTQQVIGALAETKTIHVVPWSSTLALKGQTASMRELANRFHVDAILEGSVGRSGERLRVITQLVDVETERILWSHQDERDARDLARAQDDVMNTIAGTLRLHLTETAIPDARRRPQEMETYNLYLKAVVLGDQFSERSGTESVKDFEEVIRRAPGYAPAYAGLANELAMMPFFHASEAKQILSRSRDAAERALTLDPSSALAHAARGHSLFNSWDWKGSEKEFQTALSLDPSLAITHHLYGLLLGSQGRSDEAIREARRAVQLAPTSALISYTLTTVYLHAGNFDEAIAQSRRTLELDRGFDKANKALVRAYILKGMPSESLQALSDWERQLQEPMQPLLRAHQLARSGHRKQALAITNQWISSRPRASRPPMDLVAALLATGQKDRALELLLQAVELHEPSMLWIKSTPELAEVHSDPRFAAAVALMKPE